MRLEIRVQPRSSREKVVETGARSFKIYMHEPAIGGKANKKLVEIVAKYFGTGKSKIKILSGLKNKNKIVEIRK
ncbi:MAG: DUF167 domain-containing protein [Candidatus Omnitrophica bacterium]|nr:DUF167 domain-containing protein [Candidatus Omnitrophota bacterium]